MKNRLIVGVLFIVLGALVAAGPFTIFPVCGEGLTSDSGGMGHSMDGKEATHAVDAAATEEIAVVEGSAMSMPMACHYTAVTELYVGIGIAAIGGLMIVINKKLVRARLSVLLGVAGIFAMLVPTVLVGVCGSAKMECHALTLPALIIVSAIVIAFSGINAIYLFKADKKESAIQ